MSESELEQETDKLIAVAQAAWQKSSVCAELKTSKMNTFAIQEIWKNGWAGGVRTVLENRADSQAAWLMCSIYKKAKQAGMNILAIQEIWKNGWAGGIQAYLDGTVVMPPGGHSNATS